MKKSLVRKTLKMTVVLVSFFNLTVSVYAASFSDVPSNHWANSSISKMADLGIMVGDSSGKYNPNQVIDKFYASKAMARIAGYKTVGFTAAEKTFQDNAYDANKTTLNLFKNTFSKWDSTADREIAYLLEKQVLTIEDLNKFVTKQTNGSENIRALTKEDAALFLVKLMGKQQDALSQNPSSWTLFADDSQISGSTRPFVYYMKQTGMLSGDTSNKFNPGQSVTKAVFATMLNNAYTSNSAGSGSGTPPAGNTIESITGVIVDVYPTKGAVQIETASGSKSIHNVASGTSITIDGFVRTISDLQKGMKFNAVLVNDEFTNFKATSAASATSTITQSSPVPVNVSTIEGTVSHVAQDSAAQTISIDVRMLNTVGTVYTETRVFGLTTDCKITKDTKALSFPEIKVGDIVSAQVSGNTAYSVDVRQAEMNFSGTLVEKSLNDLTSTRYYVIEDLNKKKYELVVTDQTVIERAPSEHNLKWNDLKLGDKVEVKTSYNNITYIKGEGNRTNVEGTVKEMHIYENDNGAIVFKNSVTNETTKYSLQTNIVDIYSMRIGDKLRLRLDSKEIDSYTKLENASTQNVTGRVTSLKSQYLVLLPSGNSQGIQISFDSNTYVYDAISRKTASPSSLMQNMELFVTYQQGSTNYASSITILSK